MNHEQPAHRLAVLCAVFDTDDGAREIMDLISVATTGTHKEQCARAAEFGALLVSQVESQVHQDQMLALYEAEVVHVACVDSALLLGYYTAKAAFWAGDLRRSDLESYKAAQTSIGLTISAVHVDRINEIRQ